MYDGITFHDIEDETYLKIKVPMVCRGIKDTVEKILEFRIYPTQEPEIRYSPYDAVLMNPDLVDLFL